MTPLDYQSEYQLCDTLERGHTCSCGLYLEWSMAHRHAGIKNQLFQTCPNCGRNYRKHMQSHEYAMFAPPKSKKPKQARERIENPVTPYDEDGISLGEALKKIGE